MRFAVLGPLSITTDAGDEIVVRSRNERTLLGVLLMRAGRAVTAEHLVDAVWQHRPPASHMSNLQTYVSRLRDRLPGVTIECVNGSYRLPVTFGDLDVLVFRRESAAGRQALDRRDPDLAAERLRDALRQWRGRPLADLSIPLLEPEIAQLEAERLSAVEDRVDAELSAAHGPGGAGAARQAPGADLPTASADLLEELHRLVTEYPMRERLHAHLMVALCRAGRRAEALAAYHQAREVLVAELGIEPGAQLQQLHRAILRGEEPRVLTRARRIPAPLPAAAPRPATARRSTGRPAPGSPSGQAPEQTPGRPSGQPPGRAAAQPLGRAPAQPPGRALAQPSGTAPGQAAERLPAALPSPFPVCQLPSPITGFVGRSEVIELVSARVAPSAVAVPVVVVSGQPGVGKSALVVKVAHRLRATFPDGQLFVHLGGGSRPRDPTDVLTDLLRILGMPSSALPRDVPALSAAYRTRLADRRILVVLDDAADPAQVRALTPGTPGSAVLVTSRSRLSGLTEAAHLPLEPLTDAEARALLAHVVGAARVGGEDRQVGRIVTACGNLPLALRIAGTRLITRGLKLEALADRLDDERQRLTELAISDQQVRASLALSVDALSGPAQSAFELLGVVGRVGACDGGSLDAVDYPGWAIAALVGRPDAEAVIDELVEASLLDSVDPGAGPTTEPRYRLHDLLRVYAEELAAAHPEAGEAALCRLLSVAAGLADTAARRLPRTLTWSRLPIEDQQPAADRPAGVDVMPVGSLERAAADPPAWFAAERNLLVTAVVAGYAAGIDRPAVRLATRLAPFLWIGGHWAALDRVRECAEPAAARAGEARTGLLFEFLAGVLGLVRGDLVEAAGNFATARAGFERLGDRYGLACVLGDQAVLYDYQDRPEEAVRAARTAVELFQAHGDRVAAMLVSPGLSSALRSTGRLVEALEVDLAAVAAARETATEPVVLARCLNALALSRLLSGDCEEAYRAAEEAARLLRYTGDRYVLLAALRQLALAAAGRRLRAESVELLKRSHALAVELGDRLWATGLERDIAVSWIARGRAEDAVTVLQRCLRTFSAMRLRSGQAATLSMLARAYEALRRPAAAQAARRGAERLMDPRDARTPALTTIVLRLADPADDEVSRDTVDTIDGNDDGGNDAGGNGNGGRSGAQKASHPATSVNP